MKHKSILPLKCNYASIYKSNPSLGLYRSELNGRNVSTVTKQHCLPARALTTYLTQQVPLSIRHVSWHICLLHLEVQQPAIKCPRAKLQFTALDVKWKPSHIHVTCADEYSLKSREEKRWTQLKQSRYQSQVKSSKDATKGKNLIKNCVFGTAIWK